jgi:hypothetical protein
MRRLAILVAVAAVLLGTGLAYASAPRTPRFRAGSWSGRRPARIDFSGDGGNIVVNIHWQAWKRFYAYGVGTSYILSCNPNCATGSATPVSATITLSHPISGHWTKLLEIRDGQRATFYYPGSWPYGAG